MAVVMKTSQSVEDVEKPGRISQELLHKFESDPSLVRPQSLPVGHFRLSAQSFTSSSGEITTSHENLKEKKTRATLKMQETNEEHLFLSSAEEDMLSDEEAGNEKKKKKRKLRWKWSPLKKMRRLFRRRKSAVRVKSCEELPKGHYNPPARLTSNGEDSDSPMDRVRSESSLLDTKTKTAHATIEMHERKMIVGSLVGRNEESDSREVVGKLLEDLKSVEQDKSQENVSSMDPTTIADERESQAHSVNPAGGVCTVVDWSMRLSYDSGTETAVSFEDLPHSSSLEGLQAAHDRIKAAPKHRRPPTRARCNSSSVNLVTSSELPHRRSKTDLKDLIVKPNVESASGSESSATIFESQEVNEEQSKESFLDDLKVNAENSISKPSQTNNEMLARSTEEKEDSNVKDAEKNKQGYATDCSADRELKCVKDNTNKENETDSKKSVFYEKTKEEIETNDKVLKELNNKNKECRSVLEKRSESVDLMEVKRPETDWHLTEAAGKPPQVSWRGVSLNTVESHTRKHCDLKVKTFIKGRERLGETSVCNENQSTVTQSSNVCHEQTEPKVSTAGLDEKNSLVCDKEKSSVQPSWVELANQRSKRLSQLFNEGAKEADSQASLKASFNTAANNDENKPIPRDKVKPEVPSEKDGLTNKAKKPKPDPSRKPLYGKIDNGMSVGNTSGQGKVNPDKRFLAHVSNSDTCVVCGTAVYQMEKCSLDHWVLHRRCVKCTICKRLLTVGNFVMAECKVYCKPHAKAVTVSM